MMTKEKILIVDDEERNVALLKALLMTSEDYQLFECLRGEEAVQKTGEINPDLVILDIMMPGMDGFEVCSVLKQDQKTKMIPVLMVTVLTEKEDRIRAMEVGADDFLTKPVDRIELLIRVKSLLRIKKYHDELLESYADIAVKNQKLKELEKIKEGLTHMIIHDLKNPLTAITTRLELTLMKTKGSSKTIKDSLQKCLNYCSDLDQMIQSLLDIHRMEQGTLRPAKESTDPVELIDDVLEEFRPKAVIDGISIMFSRPTHMFRIPIDRSLIKRVLANLLDNAIRNTPEGGTVTVAAEAEDNAVCFLVTDTGKGLAREYHKRIFERFQQLELKGKGVTTGRSGLGLAFCKMVVEAHGGRIWVESKGEGKGSTFGFTIPN